MICGVMPITSNVQLHAGHDHIDLDRNGCTAGAVIDVLYLHCGQSQFREHQMVAGSLGIWLRPAIEIGRIKYERIIGQLCRHADVEFLLKLRTPSSRWQAGNERTSW